MATFLTPEEIHSVLMKINPNKAHGSDGLTSDFYKTGWPNFGFEIINAIMKFFHSGFLPLSTNATILALVPKKP